MVYIDTNIIMRYLLDDHKELSEKAKQIIDSETKLFICDGVFVEIIYVLTKVYRVERELVKRTISELLSKRNIYISDESVIKKSLELFTKYHIDYMDSLLCAYNHTNSIKIETFDKKLEKLLI